MFRREKGHPAKPPYPGRTLLQILPTKGALLPEESLRKASLPDLFFSLEAAAVEDERGNRTGSAAKTMIYEEVSHRESEALGMAGALSNLRIETESIEDLFRTYERCRTTHGAEDRERGFWRLSCEVSHRVHLLRVLERSIRFYWPATTVSPEEESDDGE